MLQHEKATFLPPTGVKVTVKIKERRIIYALCWTRIAYLMHDRCEQQHKQFGK